MSGWEGPGLGRSRCALGLGQLRGVVVVAVLLADHVSRHQSYPIVKRSPAERGWMVGLRDRRRRLSLTRTKLRKSLADVLLDSVDVVGDVEAVRLAVLGGDVADVDLGRGRGEHAAADARLPAGSAGRWCRGCPGRGRSGRLRGSPARRPGAPARSPAAGRPPRCGPGPSPLSSDAPMLRLALRWSRTSSVRAQSVTFAERRGDDLAAHREHAAGLADGVLEVADDAGHGDDEQVAEASARPGRSRRRSGTGRAS